MRRRIACDDVSVAASEPLAATPAPEPTPCFADLPSAVTCLVLSHLDMYAHARARCVSSRLKALGVTAQASPSTICFHSLATHAAESRSAGVLNPAACSTCLAAPLRCRERKTRDGSGGANRILTWMRPRVLDLHQTRFSEPLLLKIFRGMHASLVTLRLNGVSLESLTVLHDELPNLTDLHLYYDVTHVRKGRLRALTRLLRFSMTAGLYDSADWSPSSFPISLVELALHSVVPTHDGKPVAFNWLRNMGIMPALVRLTLYDIVPPSATDMEQFAPLLRASSLVVL